MSFHVPLNLCSTMASASHVACAPNRPTPGEKPVTGRTVTSPTRKGPASGGSGGAGSVREWIARLQRERGDETHGAGP